MFLELHSCFTLKINFNICACFIHSVIHKHRGSTVLSLVGVTTLPCTIFYIGM
jgi:hypothetical protein